MKHPIFVFYGLALIGLAGFGEYKQWSWSDVDEVQGVPKSVRDNPGIYRSIYRNYSRYSGGK
jgi:hypothetical protein